jgi:hypothetical protein
VTQIGDPYAEVNGVNVIAISSDETVTRTKNIDGKTSEPKAILNCKINEVIVEVTRLV